MFSHTSRKSSRHTLWDRSRVDGPTPGWIEGKCIDALRENSTRVSESWKNRIIISWWVAQGINPYQTESISRLDLGKLYLRFDRECFWFGGDKANLPLPFPIECTTWPDNWPCYRRPGEDFPSGTGDCHRTAGTCQSVRFSTCSRRWRSAACPASLPPSGLPWHEPRGRWRDSCRNQASRWCRRSREQADGFKELSVNSHTIVFSSWSFTSSLHELLSPTKDKEINGTSSSGPKRKTVPVYSLSTRAARSN